jgi:hypothetical protein
MGHGPFLWLGYYFLLLKKSYERFKVHRSFAAQFDISPYMTFSLYDPLCSSKLYMFLGKPET